MKTALMDRGKGPKYLKTPFDEENAKEKSAMSREVSVEAKMNLMSELK